MALRRATFAAGDFHAAEHAFGQVPGVVSTRVGYTGGHAPDPSHEDVQTDATGHAEAVEVTYDADAIGYEALLDAFWACHDPTQLNRQGAHVGSRYRSAIFAHSPEQKAAAALARKVLAKSGRYTRPVMTEIVQAGDFFPAAAEHQQYFTRRGVKNPGPE